MDRNHDIITFDCYGTLIDWEGGIAAAFLDLAGSEGLVLQRNDVLRAYEHFEPLVEREQYRSYRQVLAETSLRIADTHGWHIPSEHLEFLSDSLPRWRPFPDTNPALERLRAAGYRLGILSNVDDDLLAETRKHFTVDFDLIITAQQVRSYKPGLAHFITAREHLGQIPWLHAAESNFHDIVPTNALEIPNAWINRRGQQPLPGGVPGRELQDLTGLADWLT